VAVGDQHVVVVVNHVAGVRPVSEMAYQLDDSVTYVVVTGPAGCDWVNLTLEMVGEVQALSAM
jgi:hypothetical protein